MSCVSAMLITYSSYCYGDHRDLHSFPTRRSSDLKPDLVLGFSDLQADIARDLARAGLNIMIFNQRSVDEILSMILTLSSLVRSEEHTSELQSQSNLVCRLLLEKKKMLRSTHTHNL